MQFPTQEEIESFKYGTFLLVDAALWVFLLLAAEHLTQVSVHSVALDASARYALFMGVKHIPRLRVRRRHERKP